MVMRLKVLGCSGADFPGHPLSGFLLDGKILFDAGSLTHVLSDQAQRKIETVFVTHAHLDHIIGIPFLADNIIVGNFPNRLSIIAIPSVIRCIKRNLFNSSVWPDFTEIPNLEKSILNLTELRDGQPTPINGYIVTPYRVCHSVPAVGYLVEDRHRRRFFYTGDTGPTEETWKRLRGVKIHCLLIDVSFPNGMKGIALRSKHFIPDMLRDELSKIDPPPERIYVTHLKPQYERLIRKELDRLGVNNLSLLRDGETIRV